MDKPNIIYILADDIGYGDVSHLNESAAFKTPHLDQLCKDGLHFTDAHATSSVCTPSRYSIMTGRYNWRSWLKSSVLFGYDKPLIEKDQPTIASFLQTQGYHTSCIGKWHLGFQWPLTDPSDHTSINFQLPLTDTPVDHGFDYFYGIAGSLDMPPYVYVENHHVTSLPNRVEKCQSKTNHSLTKHFFRDGLTGADFIHQDVLPNFTNRVLDQIEASKDNPFFIYYPMTAPHTPIMPSEAFIGKSGTNLYGDFVLMCDDIVGKITSKLDELGLSDNTIVIYTSDNGCSPMANFPELAQFGHNPSYIFRGHKADIYEGGHRVPYIIKWPSNIKASTQCHEPVMLSDFYQTIVDLLQGETTDNEAPDSVSNLPLWLDQPLNGSIHESLVHHSIEGFFSIRQGPWKLELCPGSGGWSAPKPRTMPDNCQKVQLYNLNSDIREMHNVADQHPELITKLQSRLLEIVNDDADALCGMNQ